MGELGHLLDALSMKFPVRTTHLSRLVFSVLTLISLVGGPSTTGGVSRLVAAPSLADLKGVDELKALFNRDVGKVRLVLLLSPT